MKKIAWILAVLLMLGGCSAPAAETATPKAAASPSPKVETPAAEPTNIPTPETTPGPTGTEDGELAGYFPFLADTTLVYSGEGSEYTDEQVFFDFISGNRAQMRCIGTGTTSVSVLEKADGKLERIYFRGESYGLENKLDVTAESREIVLQEPLEVGTSWSVDSQGAGSTFEITGKDVEITTAAGTFETLEVTRTEEGATEKSYYAKGLGLVKTLYESGEMTVTKELVEIVEGGRTEELYVTYPDVTHNQYKDEKRTVEVTTNERPEAMLEALFKHPSDAGLAALMGEDAVINSVTVSAEEGRIRIDFSKSFVSSMNAGAGVENMILQSIAYTLSSYYGYPEVKITLDGENYESGHIYQEDGDTFEVVREDLYPNE